MSDPLDLSAIRRIYHTRQVMLPDGMPELMKEVERLRAELTTAKQLQATADHNCLAACANAETHRQTACKLLERAARAEETADDHESQLVWLANWCKEQFGIENNAVIGRDGWPNRVVEVVAKVVEAEASRLRSALAAADAENALLHAELGQTPGGKPVTIAAANEPGHPDSCQCQYPLVRVNHGKSCLDCHKRLRSDITACWKDWPPPALHAEPGERSEA